MVLATGAWRHSSRLIAVGWLTAVLAWVRGVILPRRKAWNLSVVGEEGDGKHRHIV
ncbi:MAG: hypothetical protein IBX64_07805 [Actinobacteria bacterium]|nr:hypothetical protein [Actinomycetota bacterium]